MAVVEMHDFRLAHNLIFEFIIILRAIIKILIFSGLSWEFCLIH